jgi:hypothetical protein
VCAQPGRLTIELKIIIVINNSYKLTTWLPVTEMRTTLWGMTTLTKVTGYFQYQLRQNTPSYLEWGNQFLPYTQTPKINLQLTISKTEFLALYLFVRGTRITQLTINLKLICFCNFQQELFQKYRPEHKFNLCRHLTLTTQLCFNRKTQMPM